MFAQCILIALAQLPAQYDWTVTTGPVQGVAAHPSQSVYACEGAAIMKIPTSDGAVINLDIPAIAADVTPDGTLVLLDGSGNRVVVLWTKLDDSTPFGVEGNRLTQFRDPMDVASNGNRIAVADTGNRRVLLFDMQGGNMGLYDDVDGTDLLLPSSVAMADDGTLFIGDEGTHMVHALGPDGSLRWSVGGWGRAPGRFAEPSGLDEHGGVLLVSDRLNHRIQALEAATGETIDWWGMHAIKPREGEGRIHYPEDVAFTQDGCVVAEPFERRLQGFAPGPPDRPKAQRAPDGPQSHFGPRMWLHGRVLVVFEPEQRRFHVLDVDRSTPVHLTSFGDHGAGPGHVQHPVAIEFNDVDGGLHCTITDAADGRRHVWRLDLPAADRPRFAPDAARLLKAESPVLGPVPAPPLHRSDTLSDGTVVRLNDEGALIVGDEAVHRAVEPGIDHGQFWNPTELHVDHQGRILVLDHGNHRLQAFDGDGRWLMTFGTGRAYTRENTPSMRESGP